MISQEVQDAFYMQITTDDVLSSIPHNMEGMEKAKFVFRKEVMATAKDGRYSGVHGILNVLESHFLALIGYTSYNIFQTAD